MIDRKGKFGPAIRLFFALMEYAKAGLGLALGLFHMMGLLGRRFLVAQSELHDSDLDGDDQKDGSWDADWR